MTIKSVKRWGYQLQDIDPAEIARTPYDLVVIDYAHDDGPFSKAQVDQMKRKPDGSPRLVISYMSIGEAENYRPYWDKAWKSAPPPWLGKENRDWRGNYGVRFWDPQWQSIIFGYADNIVAAGFDGVYLDKVDEFEDMGHPDDMVEFVGRIAARVKAKQPGFLVISQNGDGLLPQKKFRDAIDAFAREDLFLGEDDDGKPNKPASIKESIARLNLFAAEQKPVLVVEYPSKEEQAEQVRRDISALGFVAHTTSRDLDEV
jgi:cysteinyl-tRNA synthetase, unknown class